MLSTNNLEKRFGPVRAVDDVTLTFAENEVTSIIGPNGAGKTTFFNLITGELEPTTGQISYNGERIDGMNQHEIAQSGLIRSYQITNIFPQLSVLENVRLAVQAHRDVASLKKYVFHFSKFDAVVDDAYDVLDRAELTEVADQKAANLSHGQQRHLDICIALATDPEILLLDEPTAGMSPEETNNTLELVRQLAEEITVIIIEHDMNVVMDLSDRIIVMNDGSVLSDGNPDEIRNDETVQKVYLGGGV
ncbi:ABC transporter ATP-binding protein [Natrarchaeobius oligotrophus]|uniref:Probable branched-chain amino acid transport ATP-binding protein LivG n=1 Tax=Natrarchaeobius chitinivorans TaxID=1679083 RepID=A0A3N6PGN8_NATCH|nr:ABC transporter ATP-binding protein [Natrarchaeobius chitinivorans]RQG99489.1 ABC transporter ATP-binding protein [Natrarchaeobius chitinivorans]